MKRFGFILFLLLLPLLSCVRELEPLEPVQEDGAPEGRVRITFSCTLPAQSSPATKALGETTQLTSMVLAVFGSSGHYKEYVTAIPLDADGHDAPAPVAIKATYPFPINEAGETRNIEVDTYRFRADIMMSNTARSIHFLGNNPTAPKIGDDKEILPKLLCEPGETAFWQMIYVPEIKGATDNDGNYLNSHGTIHQKGEDYLVHPDTQAYFEILRYEKDVTDPSDETTILHHAGEPILDDKGWVQGGVALIRNWAKIILRNNWKDDTPDPEVTDPTDPYYYGNSNFEPYSFAVVNVPERGSIVPYGGKTGFIGPNRSNPNRWYQHLGFQELYDKDGEYAYDGNLTEGTDFDTSVPPAEAFEHPEDPAKNPDGRVVLYDRRYDPHPSNEQYSESLVSANPDAEPAVYLYERPAPSSKVQPSYVIIYGKYKNPKDGSLSDEEKKEGIWCYYKIDLMEDGKYYPIYRNFKYQIEVRKITAKGHNNPKSAAESAGSADVSSDVNASALADISDGVRRMVIQYWMSKTFTEGDPDVDEDGNVLPLPDQNLFVKFVDDIRGNALKVNTNPASVTYTLSPEDGSVVLRNEVVIGEADKDGFRSIRFKVAQPGASSKTQTLRISCKTNPTDGNEQPLYRDIVLTLQPLQTMRVSCRRDRVPRYQGQSQTVDIEIPDGLVESMFPLVFSVEPSDMTLTPDKTSDINMPVVSSQTIDPNVPETEHRPRFHFERTVSWEDYNNIKTTWDVLDDSRWKIISCPFTTNCEYSGTTIWVTNHYFIPDCTAFTDYSTFKDARYSSSIPRSTEKTVSVSFGVQKETIDGVTGYPPVYVRLNNLTWPGQEDKLVEGKDYYAFTPTAADNTITFQPLVTDGNVSVTLFTDPEYGYEDVTLVPWRFTNVGFVNTHAFHDNWTGQWGSNTSFDRVNQDSGKESLFAFCTDAGNPEPTITYTAKSGGYSGVNQTKLVLKGNNLHTGAYAGRDDYYWQRMKPTSKGTTPVGFIMSSNGYVEEEVTANRFTGRIRSLRIDNKSLSSYFSTYALKDDLNMDGCKAYIEFDKKPGTGADGLVLEKGQTYQMTVHFYKEKKAGVYVPITNYEIENVQLEYYVHDAVPQAHLDYEIIEPKAEGSESSFYQYLGANYQYIWSFPRGCTEGTISLKAPNTRDAVISVIRIWGYNGTD